MIEISRRLLADLRAGGPNFEFQTHPPSRTWLNLRVLLTWVTAIICLSLIWCVWETGAVPQILFGHDLIFFLDGAWKWKWGILPHVDYYSPASALTFLLPAIGANLSENLIDALPAAISLFAAFVLPLSLYATFTRLRPIAALLTNLVIIAACLAPHELRFASTAWSYSAFYNRWGYALFCLTLVVVTVPSLRRNRWLEGTDGFIAGLAVGLLVFLKISYGLLALAVFLAFIPILKRSKLYYLCAALALIVVGVIFGALLQWDIVSVARDMAMAARARKDLGLGSIVGWALTLWPDLLALLFLIALWCLGGVLYRRVELWPRLFNGGLLFACYTISASAILMSNSPLGSLRESPVLCVAALIICSSIFHECWMRKDRSEIPRDSWRLPIIAAAGFLTLIVVTPVVDRNLSSIAGAAEWRHEGRTLSNAETFQGGPLKGLQIRAFGGDPPLPTSYVGKVLEGLALIEATGNSGKSVVSMDFTNPFNVARAVRPSRMAPTVWQLDFVYSMKAAPRPENVFGATDIVMWPRQFGDGNQENLKVLNYHYSAFLDEHYVWAGGTKQWDLYVPKSRN